MDLAIERLSDSVRAFRVTPKPSPRLFDPLSDAAVVVCVCAAVSFAVSVHYIGLGWLWLALFLALYVRYKLRLVSEESLLVIRDLGVQVQTVYCTGVTEQRFIDRAHIADVVINEGIRMQQVVYYLTVILHGQTTMQVVFENTLPRLHTLLSIYREARPLIVHDQQM